MATVVASTFTGDGVTSPGGQAIRHPYIITRKFNVADLVTLKGSALATNDVIQALNVPTGTVILGAYLVKETAITGTASALTLSLGITGVSATAWASAYDYYAASTGAYTGSPASGAHQIVGTTADTIDILIAGLTGTWTGGYITVVAICADIDATRRPGRAALQS